MQTLRVGIGGPVGSGKTALTLLLCKAMRDNYDMAVVTNDIYTQEDAQFLTNHGALEKDRILGVDQGGSPIFNKAMEQVCVCVCVWRRWW